MIFLKGSDNQGEDKGALKLEIIRAQISKPLENRGGKMGIFVETKKGRGRNVSSSCWY